MKKELRNAVVATAVLVGGVAVAAKKLCADPELRETAKQKGKQAWDDTKEFGKSMKDVAKDVSNNISKEASIIKDKAVSNATEIKNKVKIEVDSIKAEVKEKMQEEEQKQAEEAPEATEQFKADYCNCDCNNECKHEEPVHEQGDHLKGMTEMFRDAQRELLKKTSDSSEKNNDKAWTSYDGEQKNANETEKTKQAEEALSEKFWEGANKLHDFIFGKDKK